MGTRGGPRSPFGDLAVQAASELLPLDPQASY
jgi:hypothetical protein